MHRSTQIPNKYAAKILSITRPSRSIEIARILNPGRSIFKSPIQFSNGTLVHFHYSIIPGRSVSGRCLGQEDNSMHATIDCPQLITTCASAQQSSKNIWSSVGSEHIEQHSKSWTRGSLRKSRRGIRTFTALNISSFSIDGRILLAAVCGCFKPIKVKILLMTVHQRVPLFYFSLWKIIHQNLCHSNQELVCYSVVRCMAYKLLSTRFSRKPSNSALSIHYLTPTHSKIVISRWQIAKIHIMEFHFVSIHNT
jgi:hypothetical protein